ncbi:hypothetical protein [Clostridium tetani]|uniref:hypothetical protein n=1 Tax=Clostridium tetani TaxID=1513 RepID=UPI00100ABBE1|nr:hypothetical protein [Clostridium tetani]RXM57511.1 hypothetical protein DP133_10420 [Clostridium tetani]RXM76971.1 hypothetical protein DP154_05405 [Clostridium tetani]RYU99215.1 hypothetical protein DP144_05415 [Clostridium tetani]
MSKSKKHKRNKKNKNNMNDSLMELINNVDLEEVMSLLSGQNTNNINDDYDDERNTQMDLANLVKNLGYMNTSNQNQFNDPTIQLINILKPIVENNRESIEKLLQVYFLSRLISKK